MPWWNTRRKTLKAILVIDKPKECSECPCFYDYIRCQAEEDAKVYGEKRPYNCPLKPMPKRMLTLAKINNGEILNNNEIQYMKGRNDCVDEILGETEWKIFMKRYV